MTYVVLICPQGHKSAVPDEYAGKTAMCPFCQALMVIPHSGGVAIPAPVPTPAPVPAPSPLPPGPVPATDRPADRPRRFLDFEIGDLGLVPIDTAPEHHAPEPAQIGPDVDPPDPELIHMDRALEPGEAGLIPVDELAEFEEPSLIPEDAVVEAAIPTAMPAEPATVPLVPDDLVMGKPVGRRKRRPRSRAQEPVRKTSEGLPIVNFGLGFHYARLIVLVAALIVLVVFLVTLTAGILYMSQAMLGLSRVSAVVLIILMWILPVLGLTGSILCLWVPTQSRALPTIIVSLCLDGIQFPFVMVLTLVKTDSTGFLVLELVSLLLSVTAWTFFMAFLAVLSRYLEEDNMAYDAFRLIRKGITLLVCYMLTQVIFRAIVAGLFPAGVELAAHSLFLWWIIFFLMVQITIIWVIIIVRFLFEVIALIGSIRQVILSRW